MNEKAVTKTDVAIIGAGAAGLTAAIFAAEAARGSGLRVLLLEGARKPGAKILVSGGGRCNVTHHKVEAADFHGKKNIVRNILRAFDEKKTQEWFASLGVELKKEDTGKLFPVTDRARTVLEALLGRCRELGVRLESSWRVESIRRKENGWSIEGKSGEVLSRRLIVATGGKSLPKSGSDGHGWRMMRELGHSVTPTWPALVPLVLAENHGHQALSGIAHPVELRVVVSGKTIRSVTGDMLWTHLGISGPAAMDISRTWIQNKNEGKEPHLILSFFPNQDLNTVQSWLLDQAQKSPQRSLGHVLSRRLPRKVGEFLGGHAGVDLKTPMGQLRKDSRKDLVRELTTHNVAVIGDRGWKHAEVTAGGIPLDEIAYKSMHSRRCEGLYLAGEILDCEGRIGGFNFQWAWATGSIAGANVIASLLADEREARSRR